ncbi:hypothetical protein HPP92_013629 [Vanilla planifolia]|uniref:Succinate dehydrogenase subunit 5, mitochondrial n=1 Tax=Vanilla planifolia TaxID=51239 RepID=A0A835QVZ0_VANPL|nr:hypothetical protein HPP92_014066 [Vanilla planifolia]KAG0478910.1 hypothetical protein HPP92_013629 [Vanilla planifolia]
MAIASLRRWQLLVSRCSSPFLYHLSRFASSSAADASERIVNLISTEVPSNRFLDKVGFAGMRCNAMFGHRLVALAGCHFSYMASFKRSFSATAISNLPVITDPDIKAAFKDLMAATWDDIPDSVVNETMKALSKTTNDTAGKEALANVFRATEASVEFGSTLVSLRMALDDLSGLSGENVGHLPDGLEDAMRAAYRRYMTYLDSFNPDEGYLRKKVETELGTKMIHLKMRCSGIGSEWGKITLLGTSGISGSYVEYRA